MSDAYKCDMCGEIFALPPRNNEIYIHPDNSNMRMSIEFLSPEQKKRPDICLDCRESFIKRIAAELEKES